MKEEVMGVVCVVYLIAVCRKIIVFITHSPHNLPLQLRMRCDFKMRSCRLYRKLKVILKLS